jgi:hypothetical protein
MQLKKIEIVNTTDPKETERNRIKLQAFKNRIAKFFHPISKHFSNNIKFVSDEISEMPEMKNLPKGNLKDFTSKIGYAISLGFKEKEIFLFGIMQWVFVLLAYVLWLQMLSWIPQPVWDNIGQCIDSGQENCTVLADIPLVLWGWFCILLAAFPIGIFSSAMGSAHFLHKQKKESTTIKCLQASLSNSWATWSFHFIDAWITVRQIISRLPAEDEHETPIQREARLLRQAKEEALYYAWKVGTAGVLPSMVLGNNLLTSGKNSIKFVKAKFADILKLRAAYSSICWVVGITAYIGAIILMFLMGDGVYANSGYLDIVKIYQYMIIPIGVATMVVVIFLRPIYILTLCNLYSDYIEAIGEKPILPNDPSVGKKAIFVFLFICLLMILVILFRDQIGLTDVLSSIELI